MAMVTLGGAVLPEIKILASQSHHGLAEWTMQAVRRERSGASRHARLQGLGAKTVDYRSGSSPLASLPDTGWYAKLH